MSAGRIVATVITGAGGAGKTALIARLLSQRPDGERWAVLQNDFGAGGLEQAAGVVGGAVTVRAVSGCICCTGRVALRTALIALVRAAAPRRIFIEASALAEPQSVLAVLEEPGITSAIELGVLVCAVSPHQLADERYRTNTLYRSQIAASHAVALGAGAPELRHEAQASLPGLMKSTARVFDLAEVRLQTLESAAASPQTNVGQ